MGERELRIGIVGAGGIVRERHVPGFGALSGVRLDALVNRTPESSRRAAAEFGVPRVHANWRDLVTDPDLDAVLVGTWPYLHAPVTLAALDAGKHVLLQARLAMDAEEGRAIRAAALAHPELVTMVVPAPFTLWADAAIQELLADGAIGELRLVRAFWGGGDGAMRTYPGWRRQRRYSGNNVMELGIVYEMLARWVGHAAWVQASEQTFSARSELGPADVPDLVSVHAGLPGGALLSLDMSPHARFAGSNAVHLFGSDGTLVVDIGGQRLVLRREGDTGPVEEDVTPEPDRRGGWRVEEEFLGAVRGTEQVRLTDVDTAVRYMEFTDAARRSAAEGRRVTV
ncbi:Gfo/Idh/MocA family protein [Phytoactinopolyspora halotolerans]|uniref:Gfo/Idh/MocA family oxidoreductase n=1 Tax=Phytoactinopolyspora halotolerans TaxID=1981512 RepID=A0A6L9S600_9ACTN|nr:Gfo/Idh/MocA family oxidoreductase [Phytoactinopolyspora halotolerans]NED99489.1 Gfo/Idh/MocA family oxidoreductase [Phytoactinopolyspora halotolerans]